MVTTDFAGFSGSLQFDTCSSFTVSRIPVGHSSKGAQIVQWTNKCLDEEDLIVQKETLLLAGCFFSPSPLAFLSLCKRQLLLGEYGHLQIDGDVAGAAVCPTKIVFFKTWSSNETIFYCRDGATVRWSTSPQEVSKKVSRKALRACCQGTDAFVYAGLSWVEAGTIVEITKEAVKVYQMRNHSHLPDLHLRNIMDWGRITRERILQATLPLAQSGQPIGALLSGGLDSSVLVAALVENGGQVIGYHFRFDQKAADETSYAASVCAALDIPFRCIQASTNQTYLKRTWCLPHPYGHPGLRWFEQVAERMSRDGIRLLITGRYGDATFGPSDHYGLSDILREPLPWREKRQMVSHLLSTNWTLPDLFKSLWHAHSLIDTTTLSKAERGAQPSRRSDFLIPWKSEEETDLLRYSDFLRERELDFSPQDLAVEQIWRHFGIRACHPYGYLPVQELASHLPNAYRLLPYQGQKVTKPILRLAFAHLLPAQVSRRIRGTWLSSPGQSFCIEHRNWLSALLDCPQASVVQLGLIDRKRLHTILEDPRRIRLNYHTLVATAMVEIFLENLLEGTILWD